VSFYDATDVASFIIASNTSDEKNLQHAETLIGQPFQKMNKKIFFQRFRKNITTIKKSSSKNVVPSLFNPQNLPKNVNNFYIKIF